MLSIARGAIEGEAGPRNEKTEAAWLAQTSATFVTLTKSGELRGCIGSLEARARSAKTWRRTRSARRFAIRAFRLSAPPSGRSAGSRSRSFPRRADSLRR